MSKSKKLFTGQPQVDRKRRKATVEVVTAPVEATPVETPVAAVSAVEQPAVVEPAATPKATKAAKPAKATKVNKDISMSATLRQFICAEPRITVDALVEN
jgi:hypothetical protein